MRDIKFRAWDKENSIWIQINKMGFWEDGALWYLEDCEKNEPPYFDDRNDWALMQYTGLKDKNSKEIYEGDMLSISCREDIQIVRYAKDGYYATGEFALFELIRDKNITFEVVGNIYENPELLGDSN